MNLYNLIEFGNTLKSIREKRHFTQAKVSQAIGISQDTLRRIENGKSVPKLETLNYLSVIYKVDLSKLLSEYRITYDYLFKSDMKLFNEMLHSKDFSRINELIENINRITDTHSAQSSHELLIRRLNQYRRMLDIFISFEVTSVETVENTLYEIESVLNLTLPGFEFEKVHDFSYDYMEMRLLLMAAAALRKQDKIMLSIKILDALESSVMDFIEYNPDLNEILLKVYFNLSYAYHRLDASKQVIYFAEKGIRNSIENKDFSIIHNFYFRRAVAYFNQGNLEAAKKDFDKSLNVLDLLENYELKREFERIIKTKYQ